MRLLNFVWTQFRQAVSEIELCWPLFSCSSFLSDTFSMVSSMYRLVLVGSLPKFYCYMVPWFTYHRFAAVNGNDSCSNSTSFGRKFQCDDHLTLTVMMSFWCLTAESACLSPLISSLFSYNPWKYYLSSTCNRKSGGLDRHQGQRSMALLRLLHIWLRADRNSKFELFLNKSTWCYPK